MRTDILWSFRVLSTMEQVPGPRRRRRRAVRGLFGVLGACYGRAASFELRSSRGGPGGSAPDHEVSPPLRADRCLPR
jgi:hypothetical protein